MAMGRYVPACLPERRWISAVNEQRGSDTKYVFTAVGGKAVRVEVVTGRRYGDKIEILSGLEGGERVVVEGAISLRMGASIKEANRQ